MNPSDNERPRNDCLQSLPGQDLLLDDIRIIDAFDAYLANLEAAKKPDSKALLSRIPDQNGRLAGCLAALEFVHRVKLEIAAQWPD